MYASLVAIILLTVTVYAQYPEQPYQFILDLDPNAACYNTGLYEEQFNRRNVFMNAAYNGKFWLTTINLYTRSSLDTPFVFDPTEVLQFYQAAYYNESCCCYVIKLAYPFPGALFGLSGGYLIAVFQFNDYIYPFSENSIEDRPRYRPVQVSPDIDFLGFTQSNLNGSGYSTSNNVLSNSYFVNNVLNFIETPVIPNLESPTYRFYIQATLAPLNGSYGTNILSANVFQFLQGKSIPSFSTFPTCIQTALSSIDMFTNTYPKYEFPPGSGVDYPFLYCASLA